MSDFCIPSSTDLDLLAKYEEYLRNWKELNPGRLCKIGGKQESQLRHHNADQYNPLYFDTSKAIVFAGTFTESRLAAWLELMLIKFAYSLGIGVNNNRNSHSLGLASIRAKNSTWPDIYSI